jgi:hypothetical protein
MTNWRVMFIAVAIPLATFVPIMLNEIIRWLRGSKKPTAPTPS